MSCTAAGVLGAALRWVGYGEEGSGDTPFSRQWGFPYGAWCGMFVQSMVVEAGGSVGPSGTVPHTHYTPDGANSFAARGGWTTTPQAGDCVYFDWGYGGLGGDRGYIDHIGLVLDASNWPNSIETIEGNISNAVVRLTRYNNGQITGFGRPAYGAASAAPAAAVRKGPWLKSPIKVSWVQPGAPRSGAVAQVQDAIIAFGVPNDLPLLRYAADGRYQLMVSRMQQKMGYSGDTAHKGSDADGYPGPTSLKALGFTLLPENSPRKPDGCPPDAKVLRGVCAANVQPGKTNNQVRLVQLALQKCGIKLGFIVPKTGNNFGPQTRAAYAAWQRKCGYKGADADGAPGNKTLLALAAQSKIFALVIP